MIVHQLMSIMNIVIALGLIMAFPVVYVICYKALNLVGIINVKTNNRHPRIG